MSSCTSSLARRTCRRGRTLRRYTSINISTCASGRSRAAVTVHDVARDRHAIDTHALSCKAGGSGDGWGYCMWDAHRSVVRSSATTPDPAAK